MPTNNKKNRNKQNKKVPKSLDHLLHLMDLEDETAKAEYRGRHNMEPDDDDDEVKEVEEISKASRKAATRKGYQRSMRNFSFFLYLRQVEEKNASYADLLHPALIETIQKGQKEYSGSAQSRKAALQSDVLHEIEKASPAYHPIQVENLHANHFLAYLLSITDTKKKQFLKSYGNYRSALTFLFVECKVERSERFLSDLKQGMKGLKNTAAAGRSANGERLSEGKAVMSFELYSALCKWFFEDEGTESIFAHCFLTTTWNLMCRSINTVKIHSKHCSWSNDAMTIQFAHSKPDQAGELSSHKRHIYANPFKPHLCCVLSHGRYRLAFPSTDDGPIFAANSYDRFSTLLRRTLLQHESEVNRLGFSIDDIGVHSIRKGGASYATSGTTAGASFVAVCVRAGWTLGFKDRYLQYCEAGDQVVGRTIAGLDVNSSKFAVSPPCFFPNDNSISDDDIDELIKTVLGKTDEEKRLLSRFLCASLVYHFPLLKVATHPKSRLRGSSLFRHNVVTDDHLAIVKTVYPWTNEECSLWRVTFTGIPPAVRDFCYHAEQLQLLKALPELIVARLGPIIETIQSKGSSITIDDIKAAVLDPLSAQISQIATGTPRVPMTGQNPKDELVTPKSDPNPKDDTLQRLPRLPTNYKLNPKLSVLAVWTNFHLGEELSGGFRTPPWKCLRADQLATSEPKARRATERKRLSNMRKLCLTLNKLVGYGIMAKPTLCDLQHWFTSEDSPIRCILTKAATNKKGAVSRIDECHWETVAKKLQQLEIPSPVSPLAVPKPTKRKRVVKAVSATPKRARQKVNLSTPKQSNGGNFMDMSDLIDTPDRPTPVPTEEPMYFPDGPNPDSKDSGSLAIYEREIDSLRASGRMLASCVTIGYLNRLVRYHYGSGVRRACDYFWTAVREESGDVTASKKDVWNRVEKTLTLVSRESPRVRIRTTLIHM